MLMTFHKGDYMGCPTWHIHIVGIVTPFLNQQPNNRMWFKSDWMEDVFSTWNDRSAFPSLCKNSLYTVYTPVRCIMLYPLFLVSSSSFPDPCHSQRRCLRQVSKHGTAPQSGKPRDRRHRRLFWAMGIQISMGDLQDPNIWSYVKVPYV